MFLYDAHAQATDDPLVRKVLMDIRDEEKAHVGELMTLLRYLEPNWVEFLAEGEGEVLEVMEELGIVPQKPAADSAATISNLIEKLCPGNNPSGSLARTTSPFSGGNPYKTRFGISVKNR